LSKSHAGSCRTARCIKRFDRRHVQLIPATPSQSKHLNNGDASQARQDEARQHGRGGAGGTTSNMTLNRTCIWPIMWGRVCICSPLAYVPFPLLLRSASKQENHHGNEHGANGNKHHNRRVKPFRRGQRTHLDRSTSHSHTRWVRWDRPRRIGTRTLSGHPPWRPSSRRTSTLHPRPSASSQWFSSWPR
jgi:hypothetical protein